MKIVKLRPQKRKPPIQREVINGELAVHTRYDCDDIYDSILNDHLDPNGLILSVYRQGDTEGKTLHSVELSAAEVKRLAKALATMAKGSR